MVPFTAPCFALGAFNCPHCHAYSSQLWSPLLYQPQSGGVVVFPDFKRSECVYCKGYAVWHVGKMLNPAGVGVPLPNQDIDPPAQRDYIEAAAIVSQSPRGACALLRLAMQKLCAQLGGKGENANADIADLVGKGLSPRIQQGGTRAGRRRNSPTSALVGL